jgi:hypothetical protein
LDCLDSAHVVQVPGLLVVGGLFRESSLHDEVAGLLIEVLGEVGSEDDVHDGGLACLVVSQAGGLVGIKHDGSHLGKQPILLIGKGNQEHGFGNQVVQSPDAHILHLLVDKVTELLRILDVSIIQELGQEEVVEEELSLSMSHDLLSTLGCAVQFLINGLVCIKRGGHGWELESLVEVREEVGEDEDDI